MFRVLLISVLFLSSHIQAAESEVESFIRGQLHGGLIVQVGYTAGGPAASLTPTGRYLLQILDADPQRVAAAREALHKSGTYGLATVDRLESPDHLPYAENLINVVYLPDKTTPIPLAEVVRVLCPNGWMIGSQAKWAAADLRQAGLVDVRTIGASGWVAGRKPWPAQMDQWAQPRHGADGNAVSQDTAVGPPRRVRWIAGPPQEISNMVSAQGRNFYGGVIARDAFNGLSLWQRQLHPSPARGGFSYKSTDAPRPIAVGSELLVLTASRLACLDGASGELKREYPEAGTPLETVFADGLILAIDKTAIRALDYRTGRLQWKYDAAEPRCVVAGDGGAYFVQGSTRRAVSPSLVRLDLATGKRSWEQTDFDWLPKVRQCVYHKGRLVCEISTIADEKKGNFIQVVSAADGKPQWSHTFVPGSSHMKQARAMFVGDLLWLLTDKGCAALAPDRGTLQRLFPGGAGHCFPPVATANYVLHGEMHLTDLRTGQLDANPITKGNCSRDVGFMPANGLIYTTPKHCICWPMLRDYTALAPAKTLAPARTGGESADATTNVRLWLERGAAAAPDRLASAGPHDWPCYRHDAWRSGSTDMRLPVKLKVGWKARLGAWPEGAIAEDWRTNSYVRGPITPPVVAAGLVYVARPDAQQVVAMDAASGTVRWRFTANGRIDTPPTIHRGLCLFGSKTGSVYALRADDGRMVWRLQAAPRDERIVAYGQIESPWPVPGSVLVVDDLLYFAAGRHPLADGGVLVFAVRPATGDVVWVQRIDRVPQQSDNVPRPFYNSSGLEFDNFDLLHREGDAVAMSRWLFDRGSGKPTCDRYSGFVRLDPEGKGGVWMPRGCWSYAPRNESEHRKERPFLRPLAAFSGNVLYSMTEDRKAVFRRDFDLAGGEKFDSAWFAGWKTYEEARKGGDLWRSQRLARGAKWTATPFPQEKEAPPANAMLLAANSLVMASSQGDVVLLSHDDGQPISRIRIPGVVWDGLAAADGRLFAATQDGELVCLTECP